MNERSAGYMYGYLTDRVFREFEGRMGRPNVWGHSVGGEREHRIIIPVTGGDTAARMLIRLAESMGTQREIEFPEDRANIWVGKRLGPLGFPGAPSPKEPPWLVTIWSQPLTRLPQLSELSLDTFPLPEAERDDWDSGGLASFEAPDEPQALDVDTESMRSLLNKVGAIAQLQRCAPELCISPAIATLGAKSYLAFVRGFTKLIDAQSMIGETLKSKSARFINTVGMFNLKHAQFDEERWNGAYALAFAETVFGRAMA